MNKRKPAMASKHAHSPKIAAKDERASQAIVRSPKDSVPVSVDAGSAEPPEERHNDSEQDALLLVHPELPIENMETALQDAKPMRRMFQRKGLILSLQPTQTRGLIKPSYWNGTSQHAICF
jgi:hypothetical protein